jgi:hypothetical protein
MTMDKSMEFPVMMSECFWCGKTKNEILMGMRAVKSDPDRPRSAVYNYDPCDACENMFSQGIHVVEASDHGNNKQPRIGGMFPTGRWLVINAESVDGFITDPELVAQIKEKGKMLVEKNTFDLIYASANKTNEKKVH